MIQLDTMDANTIMLKCNVEPLFLPDSSPFCAIFLHPFLGGNVPLTTKNPDTFGHRRNLHPSSMTVVKCGVEVWQPLKLLKSWSSRSLWSLHIHIFCFHALHSSGFQKYPWPNICLRLFTSFLSLLSLYLLYQKGSRTSSECRNKWFSLSRRYSWRFAHLL